ncbi:MAG: beta-ketoacyl synthase chain length factor [Mariprofundaceae bacterium]
MSKTSLSVLASAVCFQDSEMAQAYDCADMKSSLLPANLRRRSSISTKMAFAAAERACSDAAVAPSELPVIFSSCLGEATVTDQLCAAIAKQEFPLSPTKFHNSVHNTASGYWSIAVGSKHPAMAMAAYQDGFALALLEAWSQLHTVENKLLLVCYEERPAELLLPENQWQPCATAFVLSTDPQLTNNKQAALMMPYRSERSEATADDRLESPAFASLVLYDALNKSQQGKIDISPASEQAWFIEICSDA